MAKRTGASQTRNQFIAPWRRMRSRLVRSTKEAAQDSIKRVMGVVWSAYAAVPNGQFSKNSDISDIDQALIYRLAHPDFDMERVREKVRAGYIEQPLSKKAQDAAVKKASDQWKAERETLFSASEEIKGREHDVTPEFRRFLSGERGKNIDILLADAFDAYREQDQVDLVGLSSEDIDRLFPKYLPVRKRMENAVARGFDASKSGLYRRWKVWSPKDCEAGLIALDQLAADLRALKRSYPDEYRDLAGCFDLAARMTRASARGMKEVEIFAICIMAADFDAVEQRYLVNNDRVRAIANLYKNYQKTGGVKYRRR